MITVAFMGGRLDGEVRQINIPTGQVFPPELLKIADHERPDIEAGVLVWVYRRAGLHMGRWVYRPLSQESLP